MRILVCDQVAVCESGMCGDFSSSCQESWPTPRTIENSAPSLLTVCLGLGIAAAAADRTQWDLQAGIHGQQVIAASY